MVQAIKRRKFLWLASKAARWIALHLHVDKETKKWVIKSEPIDNPEFFNRNYDDIAKIFKSNLEAYKVNEERTADGKFKSFTIETGGGTT